MPANDLLSAIFGFSNGFISKIFLKHCTPSLTQYAEFGIAFGSPLYLHMPKNVVY